MKIIPVALLLAVVIAGSVSTVNASIIQFDIAGLDTLGSSVLLGVDFIDGDGPSNNVQLSHFNSDGVTRSATLIGGASAQMSGYQLDDSVFYTSLLLEYSGATQLSLRLDTTNNAPAPGMFADMLSIYILDVTSGLPSALTDEPLGTNALVSWTASGLGQGGLLVYGALNPSTLTWTSTYLIDPTNPVPEPGVMPLLAIGVAGLFATKILRKEA